MGGVLRLAWGGVLELVEIFLYISWNGDIQYGGLVVPVQCIQSCVISFFLE